MDVAALRTSESTTGEPSHREPRADDPHHCDNPAGLGLALGALILSGQTRLERRLVAMEKHTARIGGLLEGLGLTGRAKAPDSD